MIDRIFEGKGMSVVGEGQEIRTVCSVGGLATGRAMEGEIYSQNGDSLG